MEKVRVTIEDSDGVRRVLTRETLVEVTNAAGRSEFWRLAPDGHGAEILAGGGGSGGGISTAGGAGASPFPGPVMDAMARGLPI